MKNLIPLILLASCASQVTSSRSTGNTTGVTGVVVSDLSAPVMTILEPIEVSTTAALPNASVTKPSISVPTVTSSTSLSPSKCRTPKFNRLDGKNFSDHFLRAIKLIEENANSDEFVSYVLKKRTYFAHTTKKVPEAVKEYREQLERCDTINVTYYRPWYKSNALGGWDGKEINENLQYIMGDIERAGHLLHETTHKYGWDHKGQRYNLYDNVNSFPYAMGYDFEDYLKEKLKPRLAQE